MDARPHHQIVAHLKRYYINRCQIDFRATWT